MPQAVELAAEFAAAFGRAGAAYSELSNLFSQYSSGVYDYTNADAFTADTCSALCAAFPSQFVAQTGALLLTLYRNGLPRLQRFVLQVTRGILAQQTAVAVVEQFRPLLSVRFLCLF